MLLAAVVLLIVVGVASSALADDPGSQPPLPGFPETAEAIEEGSNLESPQPTDPDAAAVLPHSDLGRSEAVELLQSVFEPELQNAAGIFDDLEVAKFLTSNVAVVARDELSNASPEAQEEEAATSSGAEEEEDEPPMSSEEEKGEREAEAEVAGAEGEPENPNGGADENPPQGGGAALLDSTVPLRVKAPSGELGPVDLSLKHTEGELQPVNPIVDVGVPQALGDGINLPVAGVQIELGDAPEDRSPSTIGGSVAVYPNVAEDTDSLFRQPPSSR